MTLDVETRALINFEYDDQHVIFSYFTSVELPSLTQNSTMSLHVEYAQAWSHTFVISPTVRKEGVQS